MSPHGVAPSPAADRYDIRAISEQHGLRIESRPITDGDRWKAIVRGVNYRRSLLCRFRLWLAQRLRLVLVWVEP